MSGETCSSGCPRPPDPAVPWWLLAVWRIWGLVTWPAQARQLKREGFRRTVWRTWEAGPSEEPAFARGGIVSGPRDGDSVPFLHNLGCRP